MNAPPAQQPAPALTLSDFDFQLPPELIAQQPAAERSGSRLLDGSGAAPIDRQFRGLPGLLNPGDLLVFNDTQVIKARLFGNKLGGSQARGAAPAGGRVEVLVERVLPAYEVLAHVRASKSPPAGSRLRLGNEAAGATPKTAAASVPTAGPAPISSWTSAAAPEAAGASGFEAEVLGRAGPGDSLFRLRFPADPLLLLERHGHVPLPPYIRHADSGEDARRYQTVFAARPGAVAAPTAALHFDAVVLDALRARGVQLANVTLHVGAGTFQPVRSNDLSQHRMHSEWYEISAATQAALASARERGSRIVAVGTTTLRALESAARAGPAFAAGAAPMAADTDIFITPGFEFRVVDALLTNFHLPKSTLLMLISAFAGHGHVMALYRHAIAQRYRFFSYGDAMWLTLTPQR